MQGPRIVVTVRAPAAGADPSTLPPGYELYLEALRRHGGAPLAVHAATDPSEVDAAFDAMDGLLLAGGPDIDPARYGQPNRGSREIQAERDALEARAWSAAEARSLPVLGICRGLQAINVFTGGSLVQHVDGHEATPGTDGPATHPIRLVDGTRLALLVGDDAGTAGLVVNAFHHQGVTAAGLARGLVASAWADSSVGPLVEGLETPGDRFVVGLQCHPERVDSTPHAFEKVFEAFVTAARRDTR